MTEAYTDFDFSIRQHLKQAWKLFTDNLWYFFGLAAIMGILNVFFNSHHGVIMRIVAGIAILYWSYISLSSALAAVDGKTGLLSFDAIKLHMPEWKEFLKFIGLIFGCLILIIGGFILLIVPGIYFTIRLMFAHFALADRKEGVKESMRFSWHLVQKDIFWTTLLCFVVAFVILVLGMALAGIGVLASYPLTLLFMALLYRELTKLPRHVPEENLVPTQAVPN